MARRHGRAVVPFGKYKGVRIRLLPDAYLSWLTTAPMLSDPKWWWLKESLLAELRFRGLRQDLADTEDPVIEIEEPPETDERLILL
jgi:uncharacterized protein (DUF3820 family)